MPVIFDLISSQMQEQFLKQKRQHSHEFVTLQIFTAQKTSTSVVLQSILAGP